MAIKLFGIPNCDTVKKAQTYLTKKKVTFEFINFKKSPPSSEDIQRWKKAFDGEWPINKNGLTFKKYKDQFEKLSDAKIPAFLIEHSSMIKRPILEKGSSVLAFGFDEETYQGLKLN